jgi:hypothetical protein
VVGPFEDSLQRGPKVFASPLCRDPEESLRSKGSVEMQVGEMEQAKGQRSPAKASCREIRFEVADIIEGCGREYGVRVRPLT